MAKYLITDTKLTNLASAIRSKAGVSNQLNLSEMVTQVNRMGIYDYFVRSATTTTSTRSFIKVGSYTSFFYGSYTVPANYYCSQLIFCGASIGGRIDFASGYYAFWRVNDVATGTDTAQTGKFASSVTAGKGVPAGATIYLPSPVGGNQIIHFSLCCLHV